jgi:hypothetical protein
MVVVVESLCNPTLMIGGFALLKVLPEKTGLYNE